MGENQNVHSQMSSVLRTIGLPVRARVWVCVRAIGLCVEGEESIVRCQSFKLLGGKDCLFYPIKRGEWGRRKRRWSPDEAFGWRENNWKRIYNPPPPPPPPSPHHRMTFRRSAACALRVLWKLLLESQTIIERDEKRRIEIQLTQNRFSFLKHSVTVPTAFFYMNRRAAAVMCT
jgi:hypothetical protein